VKPRNREVNIFNMSVLDLLTGALGAFCFLTLALFPSHFKSNPAPQETPPSGEQPAKTRQGIPPFSLAEVFATNDVGNACGFFKVDSFDAPRANESFRRLPFRADSAQGYERYSTIFLFDTGAYRLTVTAYAVSLPCHIVYAQRVQQGTPTVLSGALTNSPAPYLFNFEVKAEQLLTSIIPHG
jgi:hypothetical protein